eukprot:9226369-Ditylum_brightwellii.AAC.1
MPHIPNIDGPKPEEVLKKTINMFKVKICFTVPRKEDITPRDKFAALFSVIQQQYGKTTLEQWDADIPEQVQSIISGTDFPFKKGKLAIYCPHHRRETRLDTHWRLQSPARYFKI